MPPSSFTSFQFFNPPANPEATVFAPLCGADPAGPRRTSVDTGGLALALERAQKLEDEGLEEGAQDGEEDTVLAELLSEMHRQTRLAVDGRMEGFPRYVSMLSCFVGDGERRGLIFIVVFRLPPARLPSSADASLSRR